MARIYKYAGSKFDKTGLLSRLMKGKGYKYVHVREFPGDPPWKTFYTNKKTLLRVAKGYSRYWKKQTIYKL